MCMNIIYSVCVCACARVCLCSYSQNKVWIGFTKQNGKLDCDEPEDCLTKCYSKPAHVETCKSGIMVYLQCG